jgi:hypothetical protein
VHFVTSDDWFDSFQTHVRCGNMFEIVGRYEACLSMYVTVG